MRVAHGNSGRVPVIDALRGIAALAVVAFHYVGLIPVMGITVGPIGAAVFDITRYGHLGVPVFFVLSGYVIAMTASRYTFTPSTGFRFVLRRLVRIAPPYWVMVALIAGTLAAGRSVGYFRNNPVTPGQVAAHLVYAQNILGCTPLDDAFWTLCLEVQFYLVFAISAVALQRSVGARSIWFVALTLASIIINNLGAIPEEWFPRLWYQFGIGVLLYDAKRVRSARWALMLLLPLLLGLGIYRNGADELTVVLVAGLLLSQDRLPFTAIPGQTVLLGLGKISYSLYLVHGFIRIGLDLALHAIKVQSEAVAWIAIAGGMALAIAFATLFYYIVERKAVAWSRLVRV